MSRAGVGLFIIVGLSALLTTVAQAHNPRVEVGDWGTVDAPYIIEDAAVSFALFGSLGDAADVDVFRLEFSDADRLPLQLLLPVCGSASARFHPQMLILAEPGIVAESGEPPPALADWLDDQEEGERLIDPEALEGLELVYLYDTAPEDGQTRGTYFERHTQRDYYETPEIELDIEAAGAVFVAVFDPDARIGDYLLSTGYLEQFFPPGPPEPEDVVMNTAGLWPTGDCS